MRRSLQPVYGGYPEPERIIRARRRFLHSQQISGNPSTSAVAEPEGVAHEYSSSEDTSSSEEELEAEAVMAEPDIIGIANDRARNIRDYAVFDPAAMSTGIVRPEITAPQFEFKPMMFQMLQTTGQYSGSPHEDPHLHLRQFLDVADNFKIPGVTDDAFRLRLFPYSLRDRAKSWLNSLEPNSISTWNALA